MPRKNGVLDISPKFPREHLGRSLLLKEKQAAGRLKRGSDTGTFLGIVQSFKDTYFKELLEVAVNNDSK